MVKLLVDRLVCVCLLVCVLCVWLCMFQNYNMCMYVQLRVCLWVSVYVCVSMCEMEWKENPPVTKRVLLSVEKVLMVIVFRSSYRQRRRNGKNDDEESERCLRPYGMVSPTIPTATFRFEMVKYECVG